MTEQFIGKKKLNLSLLIKIVKDTGQGFIDDSVTRLSGSLAYATLFSIIPFLSLLVTIGVALHMDLANQLYIQLEPIVGAEVIGALRLIIENAERTDSHFCRNTKFLKFDLGNKGRAKEELAEIYSESVTFILDNFGICFRASDNI